MDWTDQNYLFGYVNAYQDSGDCLTIAERRRRDFGPEFATEQPASSVRQITSWQVDVQDISRQPNPVQIQFYIVDHEAAEQQESIEEWTIRLDSEGLVDGNIVSF